MSAILWNVDLKTSSFWEICLEVIPRYEESHHFCETGYFTFVIRSFSRYHLAAGVYIKHTPSIGCDLRNLYCMFQFSYRFQ